MTDPQKPPQDEVEEWVEYEVLGQKVRVRKSELEHEGAAFRTEEGTVVEKLMRRFGHLPGVTIEDADPLDLSPL